MNHPGTQSSTGPVQSLLELKEIKTICCHHGHVFDHLQLTLNPLTYVPLKNSSRHIQCIRFSYLFQ